MKKGSKEADTRSGGRSPGKRNRTFKLIAVLLPFLILLIVEFSLRLFHYGNNLELFIEAKGKPGYLVLNPSASRKYFLNPSYAPTGNSELFRAKKEKSTIRLFVLGESTTIGYPYFHNGSFHRWLLFRLMHEYPGRNFEIINLSLTAVNSYTVLGFARELVNYQPDAVLIYSGHNEYYGTLGVASTSRIGNESWMVKLLLVLRRLRIVQFLSNMVEAIRSPAAGNNDHRGQTLMQGLVADQQIPYGSELYKRGIRQFTSNMEETMNLFQKNGIPVFISNVVSNESDMKPFVSIPPDSARNPGFNKNYQAGLIAYNEGDSNRATELLESANKVYGGHALCNFYLGKLAYGKGDYAKAKIYFIRARDLDGLRFRAPSEINQSIAQLVSKHNTAHLVNTEADYDSASQHQIIGKELMLEHVHPNLTGFAILSNSFYNELYKAHIIPDSPSNPMSFSQLLATMPITAMDSLLGLYRIEKLKKSWPFNEVLSRDSSVVQSVEENLAYSVVNENKRWSDAMDELYDYYFNRNELDKAAIIMESLVLEHPTETFFYDKTANLYGKLGNIEKAIVYFRRAFDLSPGFEYARTLFVLYLTMDKPVEAMPYLNYAIQHNTSNLNFLPVRKYAGEIIQLQKEISRDSTNASILKLIATSYLNMGNKEGAAKYAEKLLRVEPKNKEALAILDQIKRG